MGGAPSKVKPDALRSVPPRCSFVPAAQLRFRGRHAENEGSISFDWPCTSFKFKTSGKAWLRMDGGCNYFNVLVNGSLVCVLKTYTAVRDYLLPECEGSSIIEVQKRTECKIGSLRQKETSVVTLHGIVLEGTLEDLEVKEMRRLEFLGDSETSGFGNLGPSEPGAPGLGSLFSVNVAHQDANQAWPALVAKALDADFHNISWSGAGVVWNAAGCSSSVPFHELYSRALGSSPTLGGMQEWQPDAIVVYLGGNDWWSLHKGEDQLVTGLRRFLQHLRELRGSDVPICILLPAASSVCACIGSLEDQATFAADMSRCWRAAAEDLDAKIHLDIVEPKPPCSLHDPEDWGQMGHWSIQGNSKWAAAVIPILKARLGLEWT